MEHSAEPQPLEIDDAARQDREIALHTISTQGDRRFIAVFLACVISGIVATATVNILVDPLQIFGTGLVAPASVNDRDIKARLFSSIAPAPRILVLGSSRSMQLDPVCIERITGQPAFNFAMNSATVEDWAAAYEFSREQTRGAIDRVLLGVDPEALHVENRIDDRLIRSRALGRYVPDPPSRLGIAVENALSLSNLSRSMSALRQHLRPQRPRTAFAENGRAIAVRDEHAIAAGTFDLPARIEQSVRAYRRRFAGFDQLSARRVERFRRLLQAMRADRVVVDAFVAPLHPRLIAALRDTPLSARFEETALLLASLSDTGLLVLHHTGTLDRIDGSPAAFYDGAHMRPVNAAKLLSNVLGEAVCAVQ